jgi:endonuclease I
MTGRVQTTMKRNKYLKTFEPSNKAKGEVARMIFYMAVRYEGQTIDDTTPDLKLVTEEDLYSKNKNSPTMGDLCILLDWNNAYPPNQIEERRNNKIQELQGNRNPFIDAPFLADQLWKHRCNN